MEDPRRSAELTEHLREVAQDFDELGRRLSHSTQRNAFDAVAKLAAERIPAATAVSITTFQHDRFVTAAATDDVARQADAIQYSLGSGPCIDAIIEDTVYRPKDLAADHRWPEYGQRVASELGLRSMLSYRMHLDLTGVIAGLNLYAKQDNAFDERDLAEGLLLVTHAAQAVTTAHLRDKAENLERALTTNRDIGTSIGVLMAQHKLTREQSFNLLRIASQNTNRKLRDVALDVIDTGAIDVTPHSRS
jgi:hypothetical protein